MLNGVAMVSTEEGWAVGSHGPQPAILHYHGGAWTESALPDSLSGGNLHHISVVSASEGWSVGDGGMFLHYTNGTWSKAETPAEISTDSYVRSVDMLSPAEGWALADGEPNAGSTLLHYAGGQMDSLHTQP
jgi:photosystem II stability/assembly factor-like uncharacterized protein